MDLRSWFKALANNKQVKRRAKPVTLRVEVLEERCVPTAWTPQAAGTTQALYGVWGSASNDVFAVGLAGVIQHSSNDGASWQAQTSGTTQELFGAWGSGPNDVFAVGSNGVILHSANDGAPGKPKLRGRRNPCSPSGAAAPTTSSPWAAAA